MRQVRLGRAELSISRIGFGCGDAAGLMVGDDEALQDRTVGRALELGVTYFDTASKYGRGRSERALGRALRAHRADAVVGTKLELVPGCTDSLAVQARRGLRGSLDRLGRESVELYQLHDRLDDGHGTGWSPPGARRLTPAEVLAPGGLGDALVRLKQEGAVRALGLTTFGGSPAAVEEVLRSGLFDAVNSSVHLLNPTALRAPGAGWPAADYGGIATTAASLGLAVLGIRALASGHLVQLDSAWAPDGAAHRDVLWSPAVRERVSAELAGRGDPAQAALAWALAWPQVTAVLGGFSRPEHLEAAVAAEQAATWTADEAAAWADAVLALPPDAVPALPPDAVLALPPDAVPALPSDAAVRPGAAHPAADRGAP